MNQGSVGGSPRSFAARAMPASVRTVCFGGEPLAHAARRPDLRDHGMAQRVFDMYGPSEDTVIPTVRAARARSARHDRPPDREHRGLRPRRTAGTGADRRSGRAVPRRRRRRAGLSASRRADGGAIRRRTRSAAVRSQRAYRTGDLAAGGPRRGPGVRGPDRPSGQDPRLPDRTGRDRGRSWQSSRQSTTRWSWCARTARRRQAPGGLRRHAPTPAV